MAEITLVPNKVTHIKTLIHMADIHIRLYKRHAEYNAVFEKLYESLKTRDLTNAAIVVAGDIVHAKTDMSPEMVRVASEFLRSLSDLAPTIIITGNHDLNLANPNRLDALTPLVESLKHPNLFYLKDSGTYKMCNVQFNVHSLIGPRDEWPLPSDMDSSKKKIALYHGPINKAQTDIGYVVSNRVTVENFVGYDMVLLGDIHKAQILQEYGGTGIPEIMYPGSLIQQNHGESVDGHGYVVWDVDSSKVTETVEIKNDIGYFTVTLSDSNMPDTKGMPENVRLRILASVEVENSFIKKVQATLRKKFNVIECTINRLIDKTKKTSTGDAEELDNIQDVEHQNTLIKQFIENKFPGTGEEVIDKVLEINSKLNEQIGEDELPKNIHWKPINLKFDNLFSYGEGNEINFEDMSGLYGVFSPNATGKTSAFDALCFALYDKTPRAFKGSHIMNTRKDSFSCELEFEIGDKTYFIKRTGTRKKNNEVKVDVNFYHVEKDGTQISFNGDDRRDTNAAIRSYVGTYEDFVLTTLSVQNQNSLFIDTGQTDRKDLLSQFIGLTVFDRLFNLASDEIKEVAGALKSFKKDDFTQKLADTQIGLEEEQKAFETLQSQLDVVLSTSDTLNKNVKSLYGQLVPNVTLIDEMFVKGKLASSDILRETYQGVRSDAIKKLDQFKLDLDKHTINTVEITELQALNQKFQKTEEVVFKLKAKYNVFVVEMDAKKNYIDKIKSQKFDPTCNFCVSNNQNLANEIKKITMEIEKIQYEMIELNEKIRSGQEFLDENIQVPEKWKLIDGKRKKYQEIKDAITATEMQIERADFGIREQNSLIGQCKDELRQYEQNKRLIADNTRLKMEIESLENEIQIHNKEVSNLQTQVQQQNTKIELLKRQKDDMLKTIKDAEELETTYNAYETYLVTIGRDGLPYDLITRIIPTLQTEVNDILNQIVDFTVTMEVDGKNINGKIVYEDSRTWPLELASGMEKFVTSLAIRVGLMSVSNLPKSNFLIIDEGLGVLDADNLSSMGMLFNILKTQFEFIILISHLDVVRDIADNLIEISRSDGYSKMIV
jgi:DNA repair exonuclease SbcCD ATPase subunit